MKTRLLEPEILDRTAPARAELESVVAFLSWINRRLGAARAMRSTFRSLRWTGTLRVLDVAAGDADVARTLVDWARREARDLEIVALDRAAGMLEIARERSREYPEIAFVRADAGSMPFGRDSFDFVISSLFLHHLSNDAVVALLCACDRIARRGIVMNDLLRRRRLLLWTKLFTRFGNEIVRFDGPLSVRKAFTLREIEALVRQAGLLWVESRAVFGHRFLLHGEKQKSALADKRSRAILPLP